MCPAYVARWVPAYDYCSIRVKWLSMKKVTRKGGCWKAFGCGNCRQRSLECMRSEATSLLQMKRHGHWYTARCSGKEPRGVPAKTCISCSFHSCFKKVVSCWLNNFWKGTTCLIQRIITDQPASSSHRRIGPCILRWDTQEQDSHVVGARLIRCGVDVLPSDPLVWIGGIDLGLPELEGDIDPGELLLALLDIFDDLWLWVHDHADQFGSGDQIKKSIIHHAYIVVLKALLGRRGQNERSSSERPGMEVTCPNAAVIQAHFTVIEGDGCTQCLQVI